jgi:hypothetical protein
MQNLNILSVAVILNSTPVFCVLYPVSAFFNLKVTKPSSQSFFWRNRISSYFCHLL